MTDVKKVAAEAHMIGRTHSVFSGNQLYNG